MKSSLIIPGLLCLFIYFASCSEIIDVDLNSAEPQIVIEGIISTQSDTTKVLISRTVNFNESNIFPPVSNALVEIYDDLGKTETLIEDTAGFYITTNLTGEVGRTYTLNVIIENKRFNSTCKIPEPVSLDSISLLKREAYSFFDLETDSFFLAAIHFSDPEEVENFYQVIMYRNGERKRRYVFDDDLSNGLEVERPFYFEDGTLTQGDTVEIELRSITTEVYFYLRDLSNTFSRSATPTNPRTNIEGAVLGYFNAYSSDNKSIIY